VRRVKKLGRCGLNSIVRFRTESGSLYEIDSIQKTWARLEEPTIEGSYPLRTKSGNYYSLNVIEVGFPAQWLSEPIDPTKDFRLVETSRVVEIL
jgi:hypothetical protein